MVCEDSHENRSMLRASKWKWETVRGEDNELTGLIRAIDPSTITAMRDAEWERRKCIMVDPSNRYSEYVGPADYPQDADLPWWLKARLQNWVDWKLGRVEKLPPSQATFPVRCETVRQDGTRCWQWAPRPDQVKRCRSHRTWVMRNDLEAAALARVRLLQAGPMFADTIIDLAENAAGEAVRLTAAREGLDRIGVRGGTEIDITARDDTGAPDPAAIVRERLERLAKSASSAVHVPTPTPESPEPPALESAESETETDIIEGEIVEQPESGTGG